MGKKQKFQKKIRKKAYIFYVVQLALVIAMILATIYFYLTMKEKLYEERQSHLIELTQKVTDVINSEIDEAQDKAQSAKNLMEHMVVTDNSDLMSALVNISELLELNDGVIFSMDSMGRYYNSEGRTGYWELLKDLITEEINPQVRDLDIFGEEQPCMVFFRKLDEPKYLKDIDDSITHVAVVIPMSSMEDVFSLSVFDNECFTYLVDKNGRRLYKRSTGDSLIKDVNVLNALSEEKFLMGGKIEDLTESMDERSAVCLEFKDAERDENYFVSMVPISDSEWTIFQFVPTRVIGAYSNSILNLSIKYFVGIAIVFCIICGSMIYTVSAEKNNMRMMEQQVENNKLLAEAAEEARRSNAAKSEFLSRMSHDIRTPINGIIGMTDIAIKNGDNQEKVKDCLTKVSNAAEHLLMLVNDVLDMSSIESGNLTITHQHMDIRKVIEGCVPLIEGQLISRQIEFIKDFQNFEHPFLLGDELHLRQIFINILGNAVKFTPDGGAITFRARELSVEEDKALYRFEVVDTGIGMSEEFRTRIYDKFAQEDGGSRTNYNGTGLGMAITKEFVEQMNGNIFVESTKGSGSCFTVEIAFDIDYENQNDTVGAEGWSLEGMRVLVAEDNELNMEIAKEILGSEGMIVTPAENGRVAADMFINAPEGSFDAILMDIMMPVLNGYEATKAIRESEHPEAETIPIIAMTANAYVQDVQAALDSGMNAHVAKPIELEHLFTTLNRYRRR